MNRKKIIIVLSVMIVMIIGIGTGVIVMKNHDGSGFPVVEKQSRDHTIQFGNYPQSRVMDEELIHDLNAVESDWVSFGYSSENAVSDYMQYKDVKLGNDKYRGVFFSKYRPAKAESRNPEDGYGSQITNGYFTGTVYWFKYEPLEWDILDANSGLLFCTKIIDCQPYQDIICDCGTTDNYGYTACYTDDTYTYFANNYEHSYIRQWLNNNFYYTAFNDSQKNNIVLSLNTNKSIYTSENVVLFEPYNSELISFDRSITDFDANNTEDKVFLLSFDELSNKDYGFSGTIEDDSYLRDGATDYAKCQALSVHLNQSSQKEKVDFILRTAAHRSYYAMCYNGEGINVSDVNRLEGVCPAIKLTSVKGDVSL